MRTVTGQFFHNIGAFVETGNSETAVGRSLVGANDCAASTGSAGEVFDLEDGVLHGLSGNRIELEDDQCTEGSVLKGNGLAFAGLDKHFLRGRVFDAVARN